jgi:hypothetical protein
MTTVEEYNESIYPKLVAAQDGLHLAGIKTCINEIDRKRVRKQELQAAVTEYNQLEEEIIELRKQTEKLTKAMTFRSPFAGYPEYVEQPIPDHIKETEELKKTLGIEKFPSYKEIEELLKTGKLIVT